MARAGLSLTTRYATRRRTAGGVTMLERDNVQRNLASCVARVYAITALNNAVRRRFADPAALPEQNALLTMLAKPLLSGTALAVLQECRERCGAQGMFRVNRIPDYIGNVQGTITAEGDNQVLQVAAGRMLVRLRGVPGVLPTLTAGAGPRERPWWYDLLLVREQALAATAAPVNGTPPTTTAIGPNCHAMDLAAATADRLAADALYTAAWSAAPCAREPLETLADVYALEKIESQAGWYTAAGCLTPERAGEMQRRLAMSYRTLAAHLPSLVDAFAIPALAAPIEGDYITAWLESAGWNDTHDPTAQPAQPRIPQPRVPEQRTPEHWTLEPPTSEHRPLDQGTLVPRNGAPPLEPSSSPDVSPSLTTGLLQNGSRSQNGTSPQNGSRSPGTSVSPPSQETSPATSATPTPTP
jgi:acyl-CoA oxidase